MSYSRPLVVSLVVAVILILVAVWAVLAYFGVGSRPRGLATVWIAGRTLKVEVADTPVARAKGLSGHAPLGEDEGMLFLFGTAGRYPFWMKDMLFPIDIIWISNGKVVDVTANAPVPDSAQKLPTFAAKEPADVVLEVPAGFAQKYGVNPGMVVGIELAGKMAGAAD
jgi:hypothetical protein